MEYFERGKLDNSAILIKETSCYTQERHEVSFITFNSLFPKESLSLYEYSDILLLLCPLLHTG